MKDGGVRLLTEDDRQEGRKNAFDKPLIGWQPAKNALGLVNPRAFACLWVVVQKLVGSRLGDLYEQPMLFENPGSIVVCRTGSRVALVKSWRNVGERLNPKDPNYVGNVDAEGMWGQVTNGLGMWRWELPRGIPPVDTDVSIESIAIKAAKLEALEEAGCKLTKARVAGRLNTNPTFFAHAQYVVDAKIESRGEQNPEELENIGATRLFTAAEIRQLANGGEIDGVGFDDGMTLGALALAGFHF